MLGTAVLVVLMVVPSAAARRMSGMRRMLWLPQLVIKPARQSAASLQLGRRRCRRKSGAFIACGSAARDHVVVVVAVHVPVAY